MGRRNGGISERRRNGGQGTGVNLGVSRAPSSHDRAYRGRSNAGAVGGMQQNRLNAVRTLRVELHTRARKRQTGALSSALESVRIGLLRRLTCMARGAAGAGFAAGKVQSPAPGRPTRADPDTLGARSAHGRQARLCPKVSQGSEVAASKLAARGL